MSRQPTPALPKNHPPGRAAALRGTRFPTSNMIVLGEVRGDLPCKSGSCQEMRKPRKKRFVEGSRVRISTYVRGKEA